jgi:hypothetical protein
MVVVIVIVIVVAVGGDGCGWRRWLTRMGRERREVVTV